MVVLDTDHMTIYEQAGSAESERLRHRLRSLPDHEKATTIITYEEQMRGWLSYVAKARKLTQEIEAYRRLLRHLRNYCDIQVLALDDRAASEVHRLNQPELRRMGRLDLRIAAITLANNATLLSRNLGHFRKVPGLQVEDWTQ
jgi:tRNA(fMet)-specific endonuclease VapC